MTHRRRFIPSLSPLEPRTAPGAFDPGLYGEWPGLDPGDGTDAVIPDSSPGWGDQTIYWDPGAGEALLVERYGCGELP